MRTDMNARQISIGWRELAVTWALAAGIVLALVLASDRGPQDVAGMLSGISPAAGQGISAQMQVQPAPVVHNNEGGFDICSARDYADERC